MNFRTFCISRNLKYQEYELHQNGIEKFYEFVNPDKERIVAIPDSCVDVQFVWKEEFCAPYVCGSFLEGKESPVGEYDRVFGVKFSSGAIPECFAGQITDLPGQRWYLGNYTDIAWVKENFINADDFWDRIEIFLKQTGTVSFCEMGDVVGKILEEIRKKKGCVHIGEMADRLGYSHRHMDRIFKNRTGISIKKYAGIIRMQKAIEILDHTESEQMDEIYNVLGYFDQAHFIHDFKKYTSCTPRQYKKSPHMAIV